MEHDIDVLTQRIEVIRSRQIAHHHFQPVPLSRTEYLAGAPA